MCPSLQTLEAASSDAVQERSHIAIKAAQSVAEGTLDHDALHPDEVDKLPLLKVT